jgi:hypothetical protein
MDTLETGTDGDSEKLPLLQISDLIVEVTDEHRK